MDNKNKLTPLERTVRVCVVIYAAALITIMLAIFRLENNIAKIAAISVAVVMIGFSTLLLCSMLYMKHISTHKRNFFLYDKKTKTNLSLDVLSFSFIRERVVDYMALFKHGKKLYVGELFADTPWSVGAMKTLLCYELLYELSEEKNVESCHIFLGYGAECAKIFTKFLMENSDYELCERLNGFFNNYNEMCVSENNSERKNRSAAAEEFSVYISSKKQHIEEKMLEYTKKNIDKFVI